MSLFFKPERRALPVDYFGTDTPLIGGISPESALYLAPVFASIRHIVDYVSTHPVDSYRATGSTRQPMNALPALLDRSRVGAAGVGPWLGQAAYGLATRGNAVGYVRDLNAWMLPESIKWVRGSQWHFDEYQQQWYLFGRAVPTRNVFHIPWIVPAGQTLGLSPIEHYAQIVSAGKSAQAYADVQRGGGIPPALLKNNRLTLDSDQAAAVQARAVKSFGSGKPFVAGVDWDLSLLSIPPNHAQFIETLKLSANQIAAIYGIDPREIGGSASESLTYTTDESRALNRAHNMRPYVVRIENAINAVLPEKQFIKLNIDSAIRADIKTRTDVVGAQLADGRMSVNEARELEDRPPVPGGDFYNVPTPKNNPAAPPGGNK